MRHVLWGGIESQSGSEASRSSGDSGSLRSSKRSGSFRPQSPPRSEVSKRSGGGSPRRKLETQLRTQEKLISRGLTPADVVTIDDSYDCSSSKDASHGTPAVAGPAQAGSLGEPPQVPRRRMRVQSPQAGAAPADDSGDSDPEDAASGEQEQLLRKMAPGGDLNALQSQAPLDEHDSPTSIGSILHSYKVCRPCPAVAEGRACPNGVLCCLCHLSHGETRGQGGAQRRKNALRPCKGKRDRYRKLVVRLEHEMERDPDAFDVAKVQLPPSLSSSGAAHEKLLAKLQSRLHVAQVRRQGESLGSEVNSQATVSIRPSTRLSL